MEGQQLLELVSRIGSTAEAIGALLAEHGAAMPADARRGTRRDLDSIAQNLEAVVQGVQKAVGPERLAG